MHSLNLRSMVEGGGGPPRRPRRPVGRRGRGRPVGPAPGSVPGGAGAGPRRRRSAPRRRGPLRAPVAGAAAGGLAPGVSRPAGGREWRDRLGRQPAPAAGRSGQPHVDVARAVASRIGEHARRRPPTWRDPRGVAEDQLWARPSARRRCPSPAALDRLQARRSSGAAPRRLPGRRERCGPAGARARQRPFSSIVGSEPLDRQARVSTVPSPATGLLSPPTRERRGPVLDHVDAHPVREVRLDLDRSDRGERSAALSIAPSSTSRVVSCAPRSEGRAHALGVVAGDAGHGHALDRTSDELRSPEGSPRRAGWSRPRSTSSRAAAGARRAAAGASRSGSCRSPRASGDHCRRAPRRRPRPAVGPRAPARRRTAPDSPAALRHQRDHVRRGGLAHVLDEVRVLLGEPGAAHDQALQPASSSSTPALRPSARSSSGFLNVEPKVLMPEGCAARRARAHVGQRRLHGLGVGRLQGERRARDDLARTEVRAPVAEAERVGRRRSVPCGVVDLDPLEHAREVAAVGVRVHLDRAADGAGMFTPNSSPLSPSRAAAPRPAAGALRRRRACAAVALDRGERAVQLHDQSSESSIGYQEVRSRPHHSYLDLLGIRPASRRLERRGRLGRARRSPPGLPCGRWSGGRAGSRARRPRGVHVPRSAVSRRASASTSPRRGSGAGPPRPARR